MSILEKGTLSRHTASHALNQESSRSHAMLTISITAAEKASTSEESKTKGRLMQGLRSAKLSTTAGLRRGKITFVDLAGSERLDQSHSEGINKKETANINKSLFQLGTVIKALSAKNPHVPYRDSKLTSLLKG
jgi:hypothetical protein